MPSLIAAQFFVSLSLLPNLNGQSPRYQSSLRSQAAAAQRFLFERCIPTSMWGMEAILPVAKPALRRNTPSQARTGRLRSVSFQAPDLKGRRCQLASFERIFQVPHMGAIDRAREAAALVDIDSANPDLAVGPPDMQFEPVALENAIDLAGIIIIFAPPDDVEQFDDLTASCSRAAGDIVAIDRQIERREAAEALIKPNDLNLFVTQGLTNPHTCLLASRPRQVHLARAPPFVAGGFAGTSADMTCSSPSNRKFGHTDPGSRFTRRPGISDLPKCRSNVLGSRISNSCWSNPSIAICGVRHPLERAGLMAGPSAISVSDP